MERKKRKRGNSEQKSERLPVSSEGAEWLFSRGWNLTFLVGPWWESRLEWLGL